ncbi:hypothetical protein DFP72DRAFT_908757 [Ephemerocybe angulata]|uniref:F-box domain-containing protein n=1 Tax=Ephemerocybe angulata TaxID=980116 RepID=A0A8H6HSX0_9AGAR|nr:hypothetical protein DFP72DRAFT_908757 [Tulosesus angulatus]
MSLSPDLLPLLSENLPPSPLQAGYIQEVVSDLEARLKTLKLLVEHVERDRSRYKAILSPIRRIPKEIIGEIITAAVPNIVKDHDERERLIELCMVSKNWRDAARLASNLWRGITLEPPHPASESQLTIAYDRTVAWLRRGGGLPKIVSFRGSEDRCRCDRGRQCVLKFPLLAKILVKGPSIHNLTLHLSSTRCFKSFVNLIDSETSASTPTPAPSTRPWHSLPSLSIRFESRHMDDWTESADPSQSIFSLLPPITSFDLQLPETALFRANVEESVYGPLHLTDVQLNRLESFSIRWDWGNRRFFSVLMACSNIVNLTIDFNLSDVLKQETLAPLLKELSKTPIHLPRARILCLFDMNFGVLDYFSTPSLTHLHLQVDHLNDEISPGFSHTLSRFILRSDIAHSLRFIRIDRPMFPTWDLREALSQLPALVHLVIVDAIGIGNIFTLPIPGEDDDQFPALKHLELHEMPTTYNAIDVIRYLRTREGARRCLLSFSYVQDRTVTSDNSHPPVNIFPPRARGST